MKIKVPFFKQDTIYSCGPATLQMAMAFFNKRISESELSKKMETKKPNGTRVGKMIDTARKEGFYCYVNDESTIEEIKYFLMIKLPVIVNFIEPVDNEGHFSVVTGINKGKIILNDPWNGKGFKIRVGDFKKRWESEDKRHKRWMLVISTEDFKMGKDYLPIKRKKRQ